MANAGATKDWGEAAKAWVVPGLVLYGLYIVSGWLEDDRPGGSGVPPAVEDTRPPTLETSVLEVLATAIQVAVWGSSGVSLIERDAAIAGALMACNVTYDVRGLMNVYGNRGVANLNLPETVAAYLDEDFLLVVNDDYATKGITIRWVNA